LDFTTRVRLGINTLLNPLGLEVGTTLAARQERARVQFLKSSGHWETPKYDQGLKIDANKSLRFLRETCLPYRSTYTAFPRSKNGDGFYVENGWYGPVDAELLYCFVRTQKPQRIFEVGSGFSTSLMRKAIADQGLKTVITSIDPEPRRSVIGQATEHIQSPVEHVAVSQIVESLEAGDLLFIDSSHFVLPGGDVPFLFLEVLPRLSPGVWVHVHDIFFPFEYPLQCVEEDSRLAEQQLVQAFLCYNETFEIMWPARYIWEYHRSDVLQVIPANAAMFPPPSSLWLRRVS
jgi:predicted O-methyltransferase YrrM